MQLIRTSGIWLVICDFAVAIAAAAGVRMLRLEFIPTCIVLAVCGVIWTCPHLILNQDYHKPDSRRRLSAANPRVLAGFTLADVFIGSMVFSFDQRPGSGLSYLAYLIAFRWGTRVGVYLALGPLSDYGVKYERRK